MKQCQVIGDTLYVLHGGNPGDSMVGVPISALDLNSWNWTTLRPEGTPPQYSFNMFSTWVYQDQGQGRIYAFGGDHHSDYHDIVADYDERRYPATVQLDRRDGYVTSNQLFFYDVSANRWEWPDSVSGDIPPPRFGHATVASGADVFLFGGSTQDDCPNDVYRLDMREMRWALVLPADVGEAVAPCGRTRHSMTLVSPKAAVVFGGEDWNERGTMFDAVASFTAEMKYYHKAG